MKVPSNIIKFNYKDRTYKVDPPGPDDHLAMHLSIDGCALFREGEEAKLQAAEAENKKAAEEEAIKEIQKQEKFGFRRNPSMSYTEWVCRVFVRDVCGGSGRKYPTRRA